MTKAFTRYEIPDDTLLKIDKAIGIKYKLEVLFSAWKQAQKDESDESCAATCSEVLRGKENFKESFFQDGAPNPDLYEKASKKILFVLKEPASNGNIGNENSMDWYKYLVMKCDNNNGDNCKGREWNYINKFNGMAKVIKNYAGIHSEESCAMIDTAMININKRGGLAAKADRKKLKAYADIYAQYIRKQIEILAPDIIVFCGIYNDLFGNVIDKDTDDKVEQIEHDGKTFLSHKCEMRFGNHTAKCVYMYHPMVRYGGYYSIDKYINLFEKVYTAAQKV